MDCCAANKPVEKSGSLAFEVILKPAASNSPLRPVSPPKIKRLTLSEEDIKIKLQRAEERRQVSDEERRQVSDEERRQVSGEERRQVSGEERRQVSGEERRQVSGEERRQVSGEERQ